MNDNNVDLDVFSFGDSVSFNEIEFFWQILPHEQVLFQKKRGLSKFVYLLYFRWFEKYFMFPMNSKSISSKLIDRGISLFDNSIKREDFLKFLERSKTINRYKQDIRKHFGFKPFDKDCKNTRNFLFDHVLKEKNDSTIRDLFCAYLKKFRIEIPDESTLSKIIKKTKDKKEHQIFSQIYDDIFLENKQFIDESLRSDNGNTLQFLRQNVGASARDSVEQEMERLRILNQFPIQKLKYIEDINLKQLNIYKRRLLTDTPERSKRRSKINRYALITIFFYQRHQESIDNLADYLIYFIHQIKKTSEARQQKMDSEVGKRFRGDIDQLYVLAGVNRDHPKEIIEEVVYPIFSQKELDRLIKARDFIKFSKKKIREATIKRYANSYRKTIFDIIDHLEFNSTNSILLDSLEFIKCYRNSKIKYYPLEGTTPLNGLISKQEQKNIIEDDENKNKRVLKKEYECAVLKILRVKLRHKEIWIKDSYKYRDPEDDTPKDFYEHKEEYFALVSAHLSAEAFVSPLKNDLCQRISAFDQSFPKNDFVKIVEKNGKPWICLTPLQKIEEPNVIRNIKESVLEKWGMIDLLDVIKEVDLHENFTNCFTTAGDRKIIDQDNLRKRLLFCLFAIGTNIGLKRTAGASRGAVGFEELRHIKKFFVNKDDLRDAINVIVNSIFKMRNPKIWRTVSTAFAADSKQFGCYVQNLLSQWSPRHHNDGVMIYWHVSDQYICVYSQLKTCTSSEVASMLQGVISQESDADIESQYVDSHGKSELGFALSYLQKFDLLPRYKSIGDQTFYLPSEDFQVKHIGKITTRSINWKLIEEQYVEMIKYTVALKMGICTAETVVRRFARSNFQHPTYKAFMELGKVVKTIFLCRYLNSLNLRQQINAGLNVVENWNSANDFVFHGKSGEIKSNYRDDQEISMLCLHLLQTCIVYINTLLVENLLQNNYWLNQFKKEDYRALTALFYLHINPYGTFELDLEKRLQISNYSSGVVL